MTMHKLKMPLPPNRTYEQVHNHYITEKAIADRLKSASREERKAIYAGMYDELFSKVPDHPRLTKRDDNKISLKSAKERINLIRRFLKRDANVVEFAPGDCKLSIEIAKYVKNVYGVDISSQFSDKDEMPDNFRLIIYDGYTIKDNIKNTIDLVFSDQLIEHLHIDDTIEHFKLVKELLASSGKYVFRTPHLFTGPHDVSRYFSDVPLCFHLKEWTYTELRRLLKEIGYSKIQCYWTARNITFRMPYLYFHVIEKLLALIPKKICRRLSRYFVPTILISVFK